ITDGLAGQLKFSSATLHPFHTGNRFENASESAASADIAVEPFPDLFFRRIRVLFEQADARHDEARRAEAAHQRVLVAECLLDRVQLIAVGETIDRANLLALYLDGESRTRIDGSAIDQHGARPTCPTVASALVARQIGAHAEGVEQRDSR